MSRKVPRPRKVRPQRDPAQKARDKAMLTDFKQHQSETERLTKIGLVRPKPGDMLR